MISTIAASMASRCGACSSQSAIRDRRVEHVFHNVIGDHEAVNAKTFILAPLVLLPAASGAALLNDGGGGRALKHQSSRCHLAKSALS
jgi:hypothetical protein